MREQPSGAAAPAVHDERAREGGTAGGDGEVGRPLALSVENLSKVFTVRGGFRRVPVVAVDHVTFSVGEGETLGLVGESGCGKTTTGRLITKLLQPTDGRILVGGRNITTMDRRTAARSVQMVFQDPASSLNRRLTVGQHLAEPLRVHRVVERSRVAARVAELLDLVGLPARSADRYPHEFSGGQRQRIGIARALSLEPRLVVLDEPVSALDVSIQAQIINLLRDLQEELGLSYVFIAHDLSVVENISTRIALMYLGRIVETGPAADVFAQTHHPYTQALLSAVPVADPDARDRRRDRIVLEGDIPSPIAPPSGCHFRTRCWKATDICASEVPQLVARAASSEHLCACHHAGNQAAGNPGVEEKG